MHASLVLKSCCCDNKGYLATQIFRSICRVRMRSRRHRSGHRRRHAAPRAREPLGATVRGEITAERRMRGAMARAIAAVGIGEGAIRRADRGVRRAGPARFDRSGNVRQSYAQL